MYRTDPSSYQEICDKMEKYLKAEKKIEKKHLAKIYLKMGNWMREAVRNHSFFHNFNMIYSLNLSTEIFFF